MSRLYSKRHYEDISSTIRRISDDSIRTQIANVFANRFLEDSRKFNFRRFMNACDVTDNSDEPSLVCTPCASERGARMPEGHIATYYTGVCGICKKLKDVTEPRDYGNHRKLLKI